jgi:hypothetical protein
MQRCVDTPSTTRLRRSVLVPESPTLEAQSVPEVARAGAPVASSVGLQIAIMFMGSTLLTPLYPLYQHEFGFSEVMLTLVYAAYAVGNLVALFLFGRVSDQIGRRRTSLPALALGAVASLIFLCANATPWLFVGRALSGLAIGVAAAAATAWAVELLRDETRASALATVANMLGVAIGPLSSICCCSQSSRGTSRRYPRRCARRCRVGVMRRSVRALAFRARCAARSSHRLWPASPHSRSLGTTRRWCPACWPSVWAWQAP